MLQLRQTTRRKFAAVIAVATWIAVPLLFGWGYYNARQQRIEAETKMAAMSIVDAAVEEMRHGAGHGYIAIDAAGDVLEMNPAIEAWTGWTEKEMLGESLERLMHPADWKLHQARYLAFLADKKNLGKTVRLTCRLKKRDAPEGARGMLVEVTARAADVPGLGMIGLAFVDRDRQVIEVPAKPENVRAAPPTHF